MVWRPVFPSCDPTIHHSNSNVILPVGPAIVQVEPFHSSTLLAPSTHTHHIHTRNPSRSPWKPPIITLTNVPKKSVPTVVFFKSFFVSVCLWVSEWPAEAKPSIIIVPGKWHDVSPFPPKLAPAPWLDYQGNGTVRTDGPPGASPDHGDHLRS